jgi:NAD(P)-dependent dehydrogenase (short-subunit alcohol dehydrogenase family)
MQVLAIAWLWFVVAWGYEPRGQSVDTTTTTTPRMEYYKPLLAKLPSLESKCVAITGTTSGLGYWAAVATAKKAASCLIMLNRNSSRIEKAIREVTEAAAPNVKIMSVICDLSSLASVRSAATQVNQLVSQFGGLDVLALNAGVMDMPDTRTVDDLDLTMATNHEGHFLLTKLVLPSLQTASKTRGEARVVTQSSLARGHSKLMLGGKGPEAKYYLKSAPGSLGGDSGKSERYHQSKMANILFAMALSTKLNKSTEYSSIKALAAAPGYSETNLNVPKVIRKEWLERWIALSAPDGSCSLLTAMFDPAAKSGDFYEPKEIFIGPVAKIIDAGTVLRPGLERTLAGIRDSDAVNPDFQAIMWSSTETGIGEKFAILDTNILV